MSGKFRHSLANYVNITKNLDRLRDYYNYEKTMRKESRDISYLESQIKALNGVSNKNAESKLASLRQELAEAREQQANDQYEHEMDLRDKGYEKLLEDSDDALEKLTDNIRRSTELQDQIIQEMLTKAQKNYKNNYNLINEIVKDHGLKFDETTTSVLNNLNKTSESLGNLGAVYGDVANKAAQFKRILDETGAPNINTDKIKDNNDTVEKVLKEKTDGKDTGKKKSSSSNNSSSTTKKTTTTTTKDDKELKKLSTTSATITNNYQRTGLNSTPAELYKQQKAKEQAAKEKKLMKQKEQERKLKEQKKIATDFVKAERKKGNAKTYKKGDYSALNTKLYKKTGGYVLDASKLKALAKLLGVKYDNATAKGALYKKLQQIGYFARGSKYIPEDQFGWTQEKGQELVYRRADGAVLTPLGKGDKVFTADMTDNLWKIAQMNADAMEGNLPSRDQINNVTNRPTFNVTFDSLIHVDGNIDKDAVGDMKRIAAQAVQDFSKQLTNDFGMFGHKIRL